MVYTPPVWIHSILKVCVSSTQLWGTAGSFMGSGLAYHLPNHQIFGAPEELRVSSNKIVSGWGVSEHEDCGP